MSPAKGTSVTESKQTTTGGRSPLSIDLLPASGAWKDGDPPGARRFAAVHTDRSLALEGGGELSAIDVAYETWGTPVIDELGEVANAVLVCHALTGDAHAAGRSGDGQSEGWWADVIGPGKAIDTDQWYVVCSNVLGGCQGTTGPASKDPRTGDRFGPDFPVVSIRDMVRVQAALANHLNVARWQSVIGGSMGGMQVLEWAVMYPERVCSWIAIATTAAASAQQIAYSSVQRSTIVLDPHWRGGRYYDAAPGEGPTRGLAIARELAQITYRSDEVFADRFGRGSLDSLDRFTPWQRFDVEGYLDYHGAKLCRRFDANSYLTIAKAMDLHDLGRNRGGVAKALARVRAPGLTVSITSDSLYPPHQQEEIRDVLRAGGRPCRHGVVVSPHGHDAFLLEHEQVSRLIAPFLDDPLRPEPADRPADP